MSSQVLAEHEAAWDGAMTEVIPNFCMEVVGGMASTGTVRVLRTGRG